VIGNGNTLKPYEEQTNSLQKSNSSNAEAKPVVDASKNLESYLLQGTETNAMYLPQDAADITPNPTVLITKNLTSESSKLRRNAFESDNISGEVFAEYIIPKVEENSAARKLLFKVIEFNSREDRDNYLNKNVTIYPFFIGEKVISSVEEIVIPSELRTQHINPDSLSPKQRDIYNSLVQSYLKRTGTKSVSDMDEVQNAINNPSSFSQDFSIVNQDTSPVPSDASPSSGFSNSDNSPNQDSSVATTPPSSSAEREQITSSAGGSLDNLLFKGNELSFLQLSPENVSSNLFGFGKRLIIPYELFTAKFNSNPVVIKTSQLVDGTIKDFFNGRQIEEFEWAVYKIPDLGSSPLSKEYNLTLFLFQFRRGEEPRKFLTKDSVDFFPTFIKDNLLSIFYDPAYGNVYDSGLVSREQGLIYANLILNYAKRTGMELILSNSPVEQGLRLDYIKRLNKEVLWDSIQK
jgi:hypothetical protein